MTPKERANTLWMVNIDSIVTGDRLYFHAGPLTYAKDPKAGHARDRALAIAAGLGITAATNPGLNADYPKGTGCCSDQAAFDEAGIAVVNLEATNWELGDKDGLPADRGEQGLPRRLLLAPGGHRQPRSSRGQPAAGPRRRACPRRDQDPGAAGGRAGRRETLTRHIETA
jgi:hypothetical protein